ncbi:hypothetical protein [Halanaerobium congolense]|nr:hypothetical protein [Halanaerobium congolense]
MSDKLMIILLLFSVIMGTNNFVLAENNYYNDSINEINIERNKSDANNSSLVIYNSSINNSISNDEEQLNILKSLLPRFVEDLKFTDAYSYHKGLLNKYNNIIIIGDVFETNNKDLFSDLKSILSSESIYKSGQFKFSKNIIWIGIGMNSFLKKVGVSHNYNYDFFGFKDNFTKIRDESTFEEYIYTDESYFPIYNSHLDNSLFTLYDGAQIYPYISKQNNFYYVSKITNDNLSLKYIFIHFLSDFYNKSITLGKKAYFSIYLNNDILSFYKNENQISLRKNISRIAKILAEKGYLLVVNYNNDNSIKLSNNTLYLNQNSKKEFNKFYDYYTLISISEDDLKANSSWHKISILDQFLLEIKLNLPITNYNDLKNIFGFLENNNINNLDYSTRDFNEILIKLDSNKVKENLVSKNQESKPFFEKTLSLLIYIVGFIILSLLIIYLIYSKISANDFKGRIKNEDN